MEKVCELFKMDESKFLERKQKSSNFVKSYFNKTMKPEFLPLYIYLDGLDNTQEEYLEFGADKCSVSNFNNFCEKLNIDVDENLKRFELEEKKIIKEIKNGTYFARENPHGIRLINHFYSRCKKLTFTCKYASNYMHYFGITGETNEVMRAFEIFIKDGHYDEICFGCRIFY